MWLSRQSKTQNGLDSSDSVICFECVSLKERVLMR